MRRRQRNLVQRLRGEVYDDIVEIIQRFEVAFRRSGTPPGTIERAEETLGLRFPPSFKWWLAHYGGGQIGGDIILGIDPEGLGPDLFTVRQGKAARLRFYLANEEEFFFDTTKPRVDGEYPVMLEEHGSEPYRYAVSFAEFLRKRILEICAPPHDGVP